MNFSNLEELKQVNLSNCALSELADLNEITTDRNEALETRLNRFLDAIGNPYIFRVGDTKVKISFARNGRLAENLSRAMQNSKTFQI